MCITLHFSGLKVNNHVFDHSPSLSRSRCSDSWSSSLWILVQTFVSSANIMILFLTQSGRSRTNIKNSSGPSTEPRGTPLRTSNQVEWSNLVWGPQWSPSGFRAGATTVFDICARFSRLGQIDLNKAFDKVNHSALYIKLTKRSIPVELLGLLENWLSDSFACVK